MHSTLIRCNTIGALKIQRCDHNRLLLVESTIAQFTPTEYKLLVPLLEGRPVPDEELVQRAFSCAIVALVRGNLDKHIDKMRGKLRALGLNVHRIAKYGYILLEMSLDDGVDANLFPTGQKKAR